MKTLVSIVTIVTMATTGVLAQDISNKVDRESYSHNKRIQILQDADECIKNAKTKEDYQQCERTEKQGRKALKGEMKNMNISQAKERILSKINERIARLQQSKDCVINAQSKDELRACKPKRDKRGKGKR